MALSSCTLTDFKGNSLTSIYAREPEGYWFAAIAAPSGAQSFSVTGAASTYLTVATDADMGLGLVATSTPIPDGWGGSVTIRQTDPTDGTHDTSFTLTVNSSQSKPTTGLWSMTPTIHWIRRKVVMDHIANERTLFYNAGATFANTLTATSAAQVNSHFTTLANAADGTSNYRILCQWNGISAGLALKSTANFGTGYCQIEADTGYSPAVTANMNTNRNWGGVIFRNIGFTTVKNTNTCFAFAGSVATGQSYNPRVMFSACKIGNLLWTAYGASSAKSAIGGFISASFAQEIIIDDECEISGAGAFLIRGTIRTYIYTPKYTKKIQGDMFAPSLMYDSQVPQNLADTNTYALVKPRYWDMVDDYTNTASSDPLHKDHIQLRPNSVAPPTLSTIYIHMEETFYCCGGYTYQRASNGAQWKHPTVQLLMDNIVDSMSRVEFSAFNVAYAADLHRGAQCGRGNLSLAWCSFPGSDRKPTTIIGDGVQMDSAQQKHGFGGSSSGDGENHIWRCLLSDYVQSGLSAPHGCMSANFVAGNQIPIGALFHYQKNANVNFEGATSTALTEPDAMTRGGIAAYELVGDDDLWAYPMNYNQLDTDFESDLSQQVHHKASSLSTSRGARLTENLAITPTGGSTVTLTIAPS